MVLARGGIGSTYFFLRNAYQSMLYIELIERSRRQCHVCCWRNILYVAVWPMGRTDGGAKKRVGDMPSQPSARFVSAAETYQRGSCNDCSRLLSGSLVLPEPNCIEGKCSHKPHVSIRRPSQFSLGDERMQQQHSPPPLPLSRFVSRDHDSPQTAADRLPIGGRDLLTDLSVPYPNGLTSAVCLPA